ncbi:uncharacterized protein SCHCODRAFT_02508612 [Schizophyllum commune H4-8]|nr:uncharacterized protein SCHCODRAFT_02508612 [Schizophyllum commune H4-8]KAI5890341.1 hypothetical protein SCHCODRAFT_02508612 [Schizophyllum commune H4-8]
MMNSGTSIFAIVLSIFLAVASTSAAVILAEFILLSALICVLVTVTGCASTATAFAAFAYLFFRFFSLLWTDGRSGLAKWASETRQHASRVLRAAPIDLHDVPIDETLNDPAHDREMPATTPCS